MQSSRERHKNETKEENKVLNFYGALGKRSLCLGNIIVFIDINDRLTVVHSSIPLITGINLA